MKYLWGSCAKCVARMYSKLIMLAICVINNKPNLFSGGLQLQRWGICCKVNNPEGHCTSCLRERESAEMKQRQWKILGEKRSAAHREIQGKKQFFIFFQSKTADKRSVWDGYKQQPLPQQWPLVSWGERQKEKNTIMSVVKRTADGTKWQISAPNHCTGSNNLQTVPFLEILIDHFPVSEEK